jgi:hypothetical protein
MALPRLMTLNIAAPLKLYAALIKFSSKSLYQLRQGITKMRRFVDISEHVRRGIFFTPPS